MTPLTKARILVKLNLFLLVVLYPFLLVSLLLDWISVAFSYLPRLVVQNIKKIEMDYLADVLTKMGVTVATTQEELEEAIKKVTGEDKADLN